MSKYSEEIYLSDIITTLYLAALIVAFIMIVVTLFLPNKYTYSYQGNITKYVKNYSYIDPNTHEISESERYIEYIDLDGNKQILRTNWPNYKLKEPLIEKSDYKYLYLYRWYFDECAWGIILAIIALVLTIIMVPIFVECDPDPTRLFEALSERISDKFSWVNKFFGR